MARWRDAAAVSFIPRRFVVNCVDTTGAGDILHGAFCYPSERLFPLQTPSIFGTLGSVELHGSGGARRLSATEADAAL